MDHLSPHTTSTHQQENSRQNGTQPALVAPKHGAHAHGPVQMARNEVSGSVHSGPEIRNEVSGRVHSGPESMWWCGHMTLLNYHLSTL